VHSAALIDGQFKNEVDFSLCIDHATGRLNHPDRGRPMSHHSVFLIPRWQAVDRTWFEEPFKCSRRNHGAMPPSTVVIEAGLRMTLIEGR
jgi:hypothetical protein